MFKNIVVAITANTAGLRSGMARAAADVQGVDKSMQAANATSMKLRKAMLGVAAVAGVALVGGLVASASAAANFESSMNRVGALAQASAGEMQTLEQQALDLGSSTAFSASEAADGMGFLAMAGFEVNDILSAMPSTLDLAVVGQMELARAADIASNVLQGFSLEAEQTGRVNDVLAETSVNANTSVEQLGDAMSYAAPIANAAGMELENTAAAIGLLSDAGIQGGRAGTTLVGIIAAIEDRAGPAGEKLKEMGIETHNAAGEMAPLADIVEQIEERGITAGEALDVFGRRAGPGMAVLVETGSEALRDMETRLDGAAGAAERVAREQFRGLEAALITLRSAAEGAMIAVGRYLLPVLTTAVEGLGRGVQTFAQVVSGATDEAGRLAPLVRNLADIGRSMYDIFVQLAGAIAPVVTLLGQVAAATLVAGLTAVTDVLASVVGWLADSEAAFAGMAAIVGVKLLPVLATAVAQFKVMATMGLVNIVGGIGGALDGVAGALRRVGVAGGAIGVVVAMLASLYANAKNGREEAAELARTLADSLGQHIDTSSTEGSVERIRVQMDGLRETALELQEDSSTIGQRIGGGFKELVPGMQSTRLQADRELQAIIDAMDDLGDKARNAEGIVGEAFSYIGRELNIWLDPSEVYALADAIGIDLTTAAREDALPALLEAAEAAASGEDDFRDLRQEVDKLATEYERAARELKDFAEESRAMVDPLFASQRALQAYADAQEDLRKLRLDDEASARDIAEAERAVAQAYSEAQWALSEMIDEQGNLVATGPELREFFAGIDDEKVLQRILDDLGMTVDELEGLAAREGIVLDIDADTEPAEEAMRRVGKITTGDWKDAVYTTTLDVDREPALKSIGYAQARADDWKDLVSTSTADTDTGPAEEAYDFLNAEGDNWSRREDASAADTDTGPARAKFSALDIMASAFGNRTDTSTASVDTSTAWARFLALKGSLTEWARSRFTAIVDFVTGNASGGVHSPQADGSILTFANGSENHIAQVAQPGEWRLWAEPETGGEAYIPLAQSKRPRSEAILGDVAKRFGYTMVPMAAGGVLRGSSGGGAGSGGSSATNRPSMVFGEGSIVLQVRDEKRVARDLLHELRWANMGLGGEDD